MSSVFDTVLVANRGEIAVRVLRTLRRLGIRSVAVYSDADRGALHTTSADVAVRLGPRPPRDSYLHIERVLDAALRTGAQAIHPGYGFLAENAGFARACASADLVFIGPSPQAIELMGDKIQARATAAAAGVPTIPGRSEPDMSDEDLTLAASEIGFPVLIKPSAGGGGKGMRLVHQPEELADALVGARREALGAFGDDTLFVERYVARSRHLEVQVFADTRGTTLHLGERECSLQRRHQKVVEEAPSPILEAPTRERLGAAAVAVARRVEYIGAGTVEFLVAADRPNEFFFIEMNTRLQVEHPVTEMVTGLDLVEHQLRVAAGEPLGFGPEVRRRAGHAIEARVYAEDPGRGFLPTGGRIVGLREPSGEGIRVDSCLIEGLEVGTSYDPLLAKVVAWGPDRTTALSRLQSALADTVLLGVGTNLSFLRALLGHQDVATARLDTELIERECSGFGDRQPPASAYATFGLLRLGDLWPPGPVVDPWDVPSGWRPGQDRPLAFTLATPGDGATVITVTGTPENAELRIDEGEPISVSMERLGDGGTISVDGTTQRFSAALSEATYWIHLDGDAWAFSEAVAARRSAASGAIERDVRAPMPGTVIEVHVVEGDHVLTGQALVVIEAMKMEHLLVAPHDGPVEILVEPGDVVTVDQVVARIGPVASSGGR